MLRACSLWKLRRQLLLTPLNGWGSLDAKKCVRTVKRARLSWEAEIQKIDPHDENIYICSRVYNFCHAESVVYCEQLTR
ncbi:hypothetical protein EDB89DRAFT_1960543 [Lactarius sanguifluus]|nr:hypothetical protein EDB89DRAFT_1960543 [Lactarius sanguifluus]